VLFMDEVGESTMSQVVSMIHGHDPNWKIGLAASNISTSLSNNIYDLSSFMSANLGLVRPANTIHTHYVSCSLTHPNSYVVGDRILADITFLPWFSTRENREGFLRWAFDNWTRSDPFDWRDGSFGAGDFGFVNRSSNDLNMEFYSSVRLELLRDGIQDQEKIRVLRDILGGSSDPLDQVKLQLLNDKIDEFDYAAGQDTANIRDLVESGQQLIVDIVR